MSYTMGLLNEKGIFTEEKTIKTHRNSSNRRIKNKSNRSRSSSKPERIQKKKIVKQQKYNVKVKKQITKNKFNLKQHLAPHNTTQYIVDENHTSLQTSHTYMDRDQFQFDFENHAIAGSMMSLFGNIQADKNQLLKRTEALGAQSRKGEDENKSDYVSQIYKPQKEEIFHFEDGKEFDLKELPLGLLNSIIRSSGPDCLPITSREGLHDNQGIQGRLETQNKDPRALVARLINLLAQKDQQIEALKSKNMSGSCGYKN